MKKLFIFMAALFVGVLTANAGIKLNDNQCVASETSQNPQTCPLTFNLTENPIKKGEGLTVIFHTPRNIKNNSITITPAAGWQLRKLGDEEYKDSLSLTISTDLSYVEFKYNGDEDVAVANSVALASVQYDKEDIGEGCGFAFNLPFCSQPEVGDSTYYFGTTGSAITKKEWENQCTCKVITIGSKKYYYDKQGEIINNEPDWTDDAASEALVKQCFTCDTITFDGKEYNVGKDGTIKESKEEMLKECFSCTEPDKDGNYYYNGEKLTDETYTKYCAPKCLEVDGKYYDNDGKEIDKDEYKKQCMCRIEDTKDGKIYYNDKNEVITADEYTNQCQPSVPTGASVPYMLIFGGAALCGVTLLFILRNKSKLKRI